MVRDRLVGLGAGVARGPLSAALIGALERSAPWRRGVLAVLTYHRVDDPVARPDLLPGLLSATPSAFAEQIEDLARHYRPVSMAEILDAIDDPHRLPPRAVHVTFDDAYADFATHAWPVLRASGVPATLFVPTAYPGGSGPGFWWDRLWHAVSTTARDSISLAPLGRLSLDDSAARRAAMRTLQASLKVRPHDEAMADVERIVTKLDDPAGDRAIPPPSAVLDWDALRRLAADGVTLAPHTRHHPLLDRVPFDTAVAEVAGAREDLEREVGPTPPVLAYPSGAHDDMAVEAARKAGMVLAVTTERGGNDLRHADRLRIRRINVGCRARSPMVRAQLLWASIVDARRR
ncbi:MAG TPA: polysaccharide deacetylase family protein [Candidatus Limnocylindrales bacterium]|nr:polysaccharide deacetylase family protein [Candidatus Limnocylindrales bacterium]